MHLILEWTFKTSEFYPISHAGLAINHIKDNVTKTWLLYTSDLIKLYVLLMLLSKLCGMLWCVFYQNCSKGLYSDHFLFLCIRAQISVCLL